jgi:tetratricopeptide (TPR) repeat protein
MTEAESMETFVDEQRPYMERVWAHFEGGGPHAARIPGLVCPILSTFLGDPSEVRGVLDTAVANCRAYGSDWEISVALMFRAHTVVDGPGGLEGVDDDLAELRILSRRAGDRWLRAQVCSAVGEAAMARSRFEDAKGEYEEALRLAYEVGAYAESPFLIARLAEIAYRAGDRVAATASLDEATAAAERYGVRDSKAYILLLRTQMAFEDGHIDRARAWCEEARANSAPGTPPPQFVVMLLLLDAMITARESGLRSALPKLTGAQREAVEKRCSDVIRATVVDGAAGLLADLGDFPRAARLLGTAEHLRAGRPRSLPERAPVERAEAAVRAALGDARCEAERARGAALTADDVLRELDEARSAYATGRVT